VRETEHFVNDGYGWACKRCLDSRRATQGTSVADSPPCATSDDSSPRAPADADSSTRVRALPRFFREGEAEERELRLSVDALARWKDYARRTLVCPRCGVEETINC
jgi:hypothetical protein